MHIFDGYAKHFSAHLVGCVETKQTRVTRINSSSCNMKCLLLEMHLLLCTYHLPPTVLDVTTCDRAVHQTSTTMHLYYHISNIHSWHHMEHSKIYSTRLGHELKDPRSLVISWNITWSHVYVTYSPISIYVMSNHVGTDYWAGTAYTLDRWYLRTIGVEYDVSYKALKHMPHRMCAIVCVSVRWQVMYWTRAKPMACLHVSIPNVSKWPFNLREATALPCFT